jgi:two-component system CheB/CheR fusion protein
VSADYIPDKAPDGRVRGYFALVQDVTKRKIEEQALQDARLRLSLALRAGNSGTFDWDIQTNTNVWSEELLELHGLRREDFAGNHEAWLECVHPDDRERLVSVAERALETGSSEVEYRIRRRDTGETRWLHGRGKVFYDAARQPLRMLGINVDITERKRAEDALREADRRKDEFLAMLAHELRNPLAPIRNVAHILSDQRADIETLRRCGVLVQRQVTNLARLVDDLLDVARIGRGLIEIRKEPIDLHKIVERSIETLESVFDGKKQVVAFNKLAESANTIGDPVRLEQVFTNLLANASRFSPPYSRIEITAEKSEPGFLIRVRDFGAGIDPQLLPKIFDLFVQGDQTLDRPQGGLGIGLTLVSRIVALHNGTVKATSAGLGKGAEFVVALPVTANEGQVRESEQSAPLFGARRRILIVEDNSDSAESLHILLSLAGHEVISTNEPLGALETLKTFAPEWIFADIGLPGLDGFALAESIRQHQNGKNVRLYALTGYGRSQDREQAFTAGFDGHLTKPIDPKTLLEMLAVESAENSQSSYSDAKH